MKEHINYEDILKRLNSQLPEGVFLNTHYQDEYNTMTIGWGLAGITWGKPVFCVAVRFSRYTFSLLERSNKFFISVPKSNLMKKELSICGTKSGKNTDKFEACGFKKDVIIDACDLHIECDVLYKFPMNEENLSKAMKDKYYMKDDYHMLYFGEIKDCFYTK